MDKRRHSASGLGRTVRWIAVSPIIALVVAEGLVFALAGASLARAGVDRPLYARVSGGFLVLLFGVVLSVQLVGLIDGVVAVLRRKDDRAAWLRLSWEILLGCTVATYAVGVPLFVDDGRVWQLVAPVVGIYLLILGWCVTLAARRAVGGPADSPRVPATRSVASLAVVHAITLVTFGTAFAVAVLAARQGLLRVVLAEHGLSASSVALGLLLICLPSATVLALGSWLGSLLFGRRRDAPGA